MAENELIMIFRRRIEPFIALGVLILLLVLAFQVYQGNNLRTEISKNCGWENDDFRCFCEKSEALAIKAKIDRMNDNVSFNFNDEEENVPLG